jgi:hypothetical protein
MKSQLVQDIRDLESNHVVLLQRSADAAALITASDRKIAALKAALSPEEIAELTAPAPPTRGIPLEIRAGYTGQEDAAASPPAVDVNV